jgi:Fe-S cluster biosynthesis and repair protein YggX
MEGLSEIPFEGPPLGQRIYDNVSKQAWGMWVEHMKMLMNEYRLNLGTNEAREFLLAQMPAPRDFYFKTSSQAMSSTCMPTAAKRSNTTVDNAPACGCKMCFAEPREWAAAL